jgi:hypothetical protein
LIGRISAARGHLVLVGTPGEVVDELQRWFEDGTADGFNILAPILPQGLEDVIELVVPELQRRGLFRLDYEGTTLRDHLGLKHPAPAAETADTILPEGHPDERHDCARRPSPLDHSATDAPATEAQAPALRLLRLAGIGMPLAAVEVPLSTYVPPSMPAPSAST